MPVTATPAVNAPSECPAPQPPNKPPAPAPSQDCCAQNEVFPACPTYLGKDIRGRIASVRVKTNQKAVIKWQMLDQGGLPLSLQGCFGDQEEDSSLSSSLSSVSSLSSSSSESTGAFIEEGQIEGDCGPLQLLFKMREQLTARECVLEMDADVLSLEQGTVVVEIPAENLQLPGIYYAEVGLYDVTGDIPRLHWANLFYLWVEPMATLANLQGPPTLAEIRLSLRDSSPVENLLLDEARFSDEEIVLCVRRPVQEWNETPPPIQTYNTNNFPFRHHWLTATAGYLFRMAEEQFRANHLPYSAGGVSLNDQNKFDVYAKAAQSRLDEWRYWLRRQKATMNLEQGYGGIGSTYQYIGTSGY